MKLRDKEINKLQAITGLEAIQLNNLIALGLIDHRNAFKLLVMHDYKRLMKTKRYTNTQIVMALSDEYQVNAKKILNEAYRDKQTRTFHCCKCGSQIGRGQYVTNHHVCNACIAKGIQI
jgi:hypothetical protein